MKHAEITRESILKAIANGAKNVSQVAGFHGYGKPVSGSVTAKIRAIVPEVAERLAGTYTEPVAKPVKPAKVAKVKSEKPVVAVTQRKAPYGGKLYGAVYAEAIAAGRTEFRPFVEVTAKKLNLTEQQVFVAANVMRIPKHQSNGGRSKDIAEERGVMHLVPIEKESTAETVVEKAPETAAVAENASIAS